MPWVYFQNQAAWDTYHNAACADRGIPKPGRIQATGEPAILHQWTDAWCDPIQFKQSGNVTTWVAKVPDEDVVRYNLGGFVVPDANVVFPPLGSTDPITVKVGNKTYMVEPTTMTWRKTKPATYVMDGVTYNTATGEPV